MFFYLIVNILCVIFDPRLFNTIFVCVEIFNMRSLWLLDLSHNEIETLPEIDPEGLYFGEILLHNNKLLCVPDNLCRLKNIEYLSLTHNRLLYVPAVIIRTEAKIKVDHNPFLAYVPMYIR
jgi:Leucine-rich repeat (LRR) protein